MLDNSDVRYKIMLIWLMAFFILWITFRLILPIDLMKSQLTQIEQSIESDNWDEAIRYTSEFKDNYKKNRVFIQMNNATEALTAFEHTIGQLEITVNHELDSSLEYIGSLRESIDLVIKPFSGP